MPPTILVGGATRWPAGLPSVGHLGVEGVDVKADLEKEKAATLGMLGGLRAVDRR